MADLYLQPDGITLSVEKPSGSSLEILPAYVDVLEFTGTFSLYHRTSPTARTLLAQASYSASSTEPLVLSNVPGFIGGQLEIAIFVNLPNITKTFTLGNENTWFKGGTVTFQNNIVSRGANGTVFVGDPSTVNGTVKKPGVTPSLTAGVYLFRPATFYFQPGLTGELTETQPGDVYALAADPDAWHYLVVRFNGLGQSGANLLIDENFDPHQASWITPPYEIGTQTVQIGGDTAGSGPYSTPWSIQQLPLPCGLPSQTVTLGAAMDAEIETAQGYVSDALFLGGIAPSTELPPTSTYLHIPYFPYEITPPEPPTKTRVNPLFTFAR